MVIGSLQVQSPTRTADHVLSFAGHAFRVVLSEGPQTCGGEPQVRPWVLAADLADFLQVKDANTAVRPLRTRMPEAVCSVSVTTIGGEQQALAVSDDGLLYLTLTAFPHDPDKRARVAEFRRWAMGALRALMDNRPVLAPNGQVLQAPAPNADQLQAAVTTAVEHALLAALPQHVRDGLCGWTEWRAAKLQEQAARNEAKRVLAEAAAKLPKPRPTIELMHDEVLAHLRDHGPCSVDALRAGVRRRKNLLLVVINKLIAEGRVERVMRGSMRCGVRLAAQN